MKRRRSGESDHYGTEPAWPFAVAIGGAALLTVLMTQCGIEPTDNSNVPKHPSPIVETEK